MKDILQKIMILILAGVLVYAGWQIFDIVRDSQESKDSYESLEQFVSFETVSPSVPETTLPSPTEPAETISNVTQPTTIPTEPAVPPDDTLWPSVDFQRLAEINPDVVGWIYIEGTSVNYPIVQGNDNSYYLKHMFDGSYNSAGCIFLGRGCTPDYSDLHSIIYGHNLQDGVMFSDLLKYRNQKFYEEHPTVLILTPTHRYKIRIFSGYVAEPDSNAWKRNFVTDSFAEWVETLSSRSVFQSEYAPSAEDRIVTLSTCTYEFDQARFVLHGLIEYQIEYSTE